MENATEALMIAFAVLVFVGALSLCIMTFAEAKTTSEIVLYASDDTNYYDFVDGQDEVERIVGMETIVPTLYRYYKESYAVIFKDKNGNEMKLYRSGGKSTGDWIGRFDITEESKRGEMWTGNPNKDCKLHLDAFLYGKKFNNPNGNINSSMNYTAVAGSLTRPGFVETFKNSLFKETLGEYEYERDLDGNVDQTSTTIIVDGEEVNLVKKDTKRVITYTLMK